jgi:putative Holliday junction resolvase
MNYLGIDYGKKRSGVSVFHGDIGIILPKKAIVSANDWEKIEKICEIVKMDKIGIIAIGYPLHMDGTASKMTEEVDGFVAKLRSKLPAEVAINLMDEGLTTECAESDSMAVNGRQSQAKRRKRCQSGAMDSAAAAIILRDFLAKTGVLNLQ